LSKPAQDNLILQPEHNSFQTGVNFAPAIKKVDAQKKMKYPQNFDFKKKL
jgi:hypothetical protein